MLEEWFHIMLPAIREASSKIIEVYHSDHHIQLKDDRSPVTQADTASSYILTSALKETKILQVSEEEEKPEFSVRQKERYIWLIDPLDGTKEFIRKNDEFCINIALIEDGRPLFGLIADPVNQSIIYGGREIGAYLISYSDDEFCSEKNRIPKLSDKEVKGMVYSRSHFSPKVSELIRDVESIYGSLNVIKKGSALKFFDLILGKADLYPRMAPTMEWDIAAGQAIYEAVGGEVLDFTNFEPLQYNKRSLYNPHFIARKIGLTIPNESNYE